MLVCVCVGARDQPQFFEIVSLTGTSDLPIKQRWPPSKPEGSIGRCLPRAKTTSTHQHSLLFVAELGIELRSSR